MELTVRILLAVAFLAVATFCVFGFVASFEPLERSRQIAWRAVHGAGASVSLLGVAWVLCWRRRRGE